MAADVLFPTNERLYAIQQEKLPALEADREIFKLLPVRTEDVAEISWEQLDRFYGLQQVRGIGGQPGTVASVGVSKFVSKPGINGDRIYIQEDELMRRRKMGEFGTPIDLTDLVLQKQDQLLQRRLDLIEYLGWQLLSTGTFKQVSKEGKILATDTFPIRTFTSAVSWLNYSSATPLNDFRQVTLFHRGYSVSFDSTSVAYMNKTTYFAYINNANPLDLYGRRTKGLATVNNLGALNQEIMQEDNLPKVVEYDKSFQDATQTPQLFIPDGVVVVVGKRPGNAAAGAYVMSRNIANPNFAPGAYSYVVDSADHGQRVPRYIEVGDGHNGAPILEYPSSIIIMKVF